MKRNLFLFGVMMSVVPMMAQWQMQPTPNDTLQPGETETVTMTVKTSDLASFNEKASAWKTDAGRYDFLICSSASDVEAKASANVKAWTQKVNNVMKPNVKLNLLHR